MEVLCILLELGQLQISAENVRLYLIRIRAEDFLRYSLGCATL